MTDAGPTECHACTETDAVTCTANQVSQTCATDPKSLGTTHCASVAGEFENESGGIQEAFIRGCFDCAGKLIICFGTKYNVHVTVSDVQTGLQSIYPMYLVEQNRIPMVRLGLV